MARVGGSRVHECSHQVELILEAAIVIGIRTIATGRRTRGRTRGRCTGHLASRGLTLGDYQVLVYLSEAEDQSMRMCDLADILQLSPSGLTRRLDRLVADGYVSRQSSPADRRVMMGSLTATGRELLERTAPHRVDSVRRRVFDHLDADQVAAMASIFTSIANGLAASEAEAVDGAD